MGASLKVGLDATPLTMTSGGLPRYVAELASALAKEFPESSFELLSDQKFQSQNKWPANLTAGVEPRSFLDRRWWSWGLPRVLRAHGSDIFHGTNFEVPYFGRTRSVITVHDLSPWRDVRWHSDAQRVRRRMPILLRSRRVAKVITVSEAVRKEAIDQFGLDPERVKAVPLAASEIFRRIEAPPVHPRPFLLFAGTIEPRKNVPGLIEAWQRSRQETGADLILAGRRRYDAPLITRTEGLHMAGEVSDDQLAVLYSQALALLYPTHYEGFGLPVLEAMQCGCPVLTSTDPAVTEVAGGAAMHSRDDGELAWNLRTVAEQIQLRERLREAGLRRARDFSWAKTARATFQVYGEALRA